MSPDPISGSGSSGKPSGGRGGKPSKSPARSNPLGRLSGQGGQKPVQAAARKHAGKAVQKALPAQAQLALRIGKMGFQALGKIVGKRNANRLVVFGIAVSLGWQLLIFGAAIGAGVGSAVVIGHKITELIGDVNLNFLDDIPGSVKNYITKHFGTQIRATLDCSNLPPSQRQPGKNCLNGLLNYGENQSPIPARADWLVPIWQQAATEFNVPWQLLAAINATRTNFGLSDCPSGTPNYGAGFYRFPTTSWKIYKTDAGGANTTKDRQGNCYSSNDPATVFSNAKISRLIARDVSSSSPPNSAHAGPTTVPINTASADIYDAVDSTFSEARMLSSYIAAEKPLAVAAARSTAEKTTAAAATSTTWNYTGSDSNSCDPQQSDGPVTFLPAQNDDSAAGTGASIGYNSQLNIPRSLVAQAAQYRSNSMPWTPRRIQKGPSPFSTFDGEGPFPTVPESVIKHMLVVVWEAFGKDPATAEQDATLNMAQVVRESDFKPYILQGYIGDVNDNNPAGGLFQFIPGTFNSWKVDGYNDRFNPLDNILATVNAQVNSGMGYVLNGASGWGPGDGTNPYTTGGSSTASTGGTTGSASSGSTPATPGSGYTPATWAAALLTGLNIPETDGNMQILVGWENQEGGAGPEFNTPDNTASYNPLNSTQHEPGSQDDASGSSIQAYSSWASGLQATATNLQNGLYPTILHDLQTSNVTGAGQDISSTKWGTSAEVITTIAEAPTDLGGTAVTGSSSAGGPYTGLAQTDPVSRAVADQTGVQNSDDASECYVAVVHDWYAAIVANPPNGDDAGIVASGPLQNRILEIAQSQLGECERTPDGAAHCVGDGSNCTKYSPSPGCEEWCADYASWVWEHAGVPGFPAWSEHFHNVDDFMEWGVEHHTWHPIGSGYQPEPGDGIDFGNGSHIGIVDKVLPSGEIIVIAGNTLDNNVAYSGPAAPSNGADLGGYPITGYIAPENSSSSTVSGDGSGASAATS